MFGFSILYFRREQCNQQFDPRHCKTVSSCFYGLTINAHHTCHFCRLGVCLMQTNGIRNQANIGRIAGEIRCSQRFRILASRDRDFEGHAL